jgi:hypothetical protein
LQTNICRSVIEGNQCIASDSETRRADRFR